METFDTNATPACWVNSGPWKYANINTTGFPSPNAPGIDDHTGNGGYFAWMDASSASFGSLTSPAFDTSGITTLGLSFWYYIYHPNFFPPKNYLAIDFYDGNTWNLFVDTLSTNSPFWLYHTIDLSTFPVSDSVKVRFRGIKGNGSQDILLDDILLGELPTCFPPLTIQVNSVAANSATIDIIGSGSGSWQYEYGPSGFSIGSGTGGLSTSQQFSLTNLQSLTQYDVYVRNICSSGDTSVWYRQSFQTLCGIYPVPFFESFDSTTTPDCWNNYPITSIFNFAFSALEDHTGNGGRSAFRSNSRSNTMAIQTPLIDLSALSQPALVFQLKLRNRFQALPGTSTAQLSVEVSPDTLVWTPLDSFSVLDFNWQQKIIDLQSTGLGDTLAIRFVGRQAAHLQGSVFPDIFLDDISVQNAPPCPAPQDSLFATSVGATSATINSSLGAADQIEYGGFGFIRGNGTVTSFSGSSISLTNLQPNTIYTVYFRDSCAGGFGPWSRPFYFKTPCPSVAALPLRESFNAMPFQSQDFSLACWNSYGVGGMPWVSGNSPEFLTGPGGNIDGQYAYTEGDIGATGAISYLESPWIDLSQANFPQMSFYYFMYGFNMGDLCVEIFDGANWDTVPGVNCLVGQQQTSDMQPWLNRIIDLSGYSDTVKIRFKAKKGSGKYSDICVDKVELYDTCFVQNPTASFTFKLDSLNAQGQYVSFTSTSASSTEYLWDFGDGTLDTGASLQHVYTANGTFIVQHVAINACDLTDTITDTVNVNGVGVDDNPLNQLELSVFPNPADDALYVELPIGYRTGSLKLVNSLGIVVLTKNFDDNARLKINTSSTASGFYLVKVESGQLAATMPLLIHKGSSH